VDGSSRLQRGDLSDASVEGVNVFDLHRLAHVAREGVVSEVQSVKNAIRQDEACFARADQRAEIADEDAQRSNARRLLVNLGRESEQGPRVRRGRLGLVTLRGLGLARQAP
jgi:hypothetical protein